MRDCWIIVPVKALDGAKSRLSAVLSPAERVSLSLEMLHRVLDAASGLDGVRTLVVSGDSRALDLAAKTGAATLYDCWNGLNPSLEGAAQWCAARGARSILVVHSDLPLVTGEDLRALLELGRVAPSVALAPCRRGEGTNALLMRPPGLIPFAFGPGSLDEHRNLGARRRVSIGEYRSPGIALDVDTVEDLELYRSQVPAPEGVLR